MPYMGQRVFWGPAESRSWKVVLPESTDESITSASPPRPFISLKETLCSSGDFSARILVARHVPMGSNDDSYVSLVQTCQISLKTAQQFSRRTLAACGVTVLLNGVFVHVKGRDFPSQSRELHELEIRCPRPRQA